MSVICTALKRAIVEAAEEDRAELRAAWKIHCADFVDLDDITDTAPPAPDPDLPPA